MPIEDLLGAQGAQQLDRPGQRTAFGQELPEQFAVALEQRFLFRGSDLAPELAGGRARGEAAAHADAPMDAPSVDGKADFRERALPGEHVRVNRVDQRAVEVEDQCLHHVRILQQAVDANCADVQADAENGMRQEGSYPGLPRIGRSGCRKAKPECGLHDEEWQKHGHHAENQRRHERRLRQPAAGYVAQRTQGRRPRQSRSGQSSRPRIRKASARRSQWTHA